MKKNLTPLGQSKPLQKGQQKPVWDGQFKQANGWLSSLGGGVVTGLLVLILLEIIAQI